MGSFQPTMVKFTLFLGVAVLKCTTATLTQMLSQLKNTTSALYTDSRGPQERNLLNSAALRNLDKYGCWCYFGSELEGMVAGPGPGRGQPVDPVDNACRALHQAYDCIIMDIDDELGWHHHIEVMQSDPSLPAEERLA